MRRPAPIQIWVYDFIADPARIPADTSCELSVVLQSSTGVTLNMIRLLEWA